MNNIQAPTKKTSLSLHALISQFGEEGKVSEEILQKEVCRRAEAEKTS